MKTVGFIGVGVMGKAMVRNLMQHGLQVYIYTRTKEKALDVIAEGAIWCDRVKECVKNRDVILTMVGFPKDVEEVYFSPEGILENCKQGTYLIDMTTSSPQLAKRIEEDARKRGLFALDAPVSGGDTGAKEGSLSIMVGGEEKAFLACQEIFSAIGKNIIYEGPAGMGQHTKMANQIAIAGTISGVCEAMTYAKRVGLDVQTMLASISQGAAGSWQMSNMAPRMLAGDFDPGFFIKHFIKDMNIAVEEAENAGLELGILNHVFNMYKGLESKGFGDFGTQALLSYYDKEVQETLHIH